MTITFGAWVHNAPPCEGTLKGNSGTLRKNLIEDGVTYSSTWQAHHLIPSSIVKRSSALKAAAKAGVYDQNSLFNGIMLPNKVGATVPTGVTRATTLPLHKGGHNGKGTGLINNESYDDYVKRMLDDLDRNYERGNWDDAKLGREIQKIQETIEADLLAGRVKTCAKCGPQEW